MRAAFRAYLEILMRGFRRDCWFVVRSPVQLPKALRVMIFPISQGMLDLTHLTHFAMFKQGQMRLNGGAFCMQRGEHASGCSGAVHARGTKPCATGRNEWPSNDWIAGYSRSMRCMLHGMLPGLHHLLLPLLEFDTRCQGQPYWELHAWRHVLASVIREVDIVIWDVDIVEPSKAAQAAMQCAFLEQAPIYVHIPLPQHWMWHT